MGISSHITDDKNNRTVGISQDRWLYVGPSQSSVAYNGTLDIADTPVNIVPPKPDCDFVITDIVLAGNKSISGSIDAVVNIYEATSATSSVSSAAILTLPVARSVPIILTGIHLRTGTASYVNGKTSDDDVFVSMLGFYVAAGDD